MSQSELEKTEKEIARLLKSIKRTSQQLEIAQRVLAEKDEQDKSVEE